MKRKKIMTSEKVIKRFCWTEVGLAKTIYLVDSSTCPSGHSLVFPSSILVGIASFCFYF